MKRTSNDQLKQKQEEVLNSSNFYLSESAKIYWYNLFEMCKKQHETNSGIPQSQMNTYNHTYQNQNVNTQILFELFGDYLVLISTRNSDQIYNVVVDGPMVEQNEVPQCKINDSIYTVQISFLIKSFEKFEEANDQTVVCQYFREYFQKNLAVIIWVPGFPEVEKKTLELTDCIIHAKNSEITYRADVKKLISSSPVLYNMVKDLGENYTPENPLNLTEFFKEFHHQHIRMYLCCIYNVNFVPQELFHILQVLKISAKSNNQWLIRRIFEGVDLGRIVRGEIELVDAQHPCYVKNVLDFARQHDLYELEAYCALEIFGQSKGKRSVETQTPNVFQGN